MASSSVDPPPEAETTAAFDRAADELLRTFWQLYPVEATHAGVHEHDARLPDWSADGQAARAAWRHQSAAALRAFNPEALDPSRRLDRAVGLAELDGREIEAEWRWQQRSPAFYVEKALGGLNYLLSRPDRSAPQHAREQALLSRLGAIPRLLAQGRALLDARLVAPEQLEIAAVATRGARQFLAALTLPATAEAETRRAQALQAVEDFDGFISRGLRPEGSFALGSELFQRQLTEQHGVRLTPDELYEYGEQLAADLEARLVALAAITTPGTHWRQAIEDLKVDHPPLGGEQAAYAAEAARARAFVVQHNLVPIPSGEQFEVRATAPFQRATMPLGHFDRTPPFAATDNLGILFITPVDAALPVGQQEARLAGHCHTAVRAICLHETYPGHHLQLWHAKLHGSPLRRQFSSTLFVEGWGLYCEELMEEAGYYDTPALSLWRLKNAMWRAVRLMVDVGLHTGRLNLQQATALLEERAGLEPTTARGEALRYTTSPTQPSSYVLGRDGIVRLRELDQRRRGAAFNLADFHTRLMAYSSVPPAFIPDDLPPLGAAPSVQS